MQNRRTSIAMVPSPGLSHLVPFVEFGKRLVHLHETFHVTLLIPSLGSPSSAIKSVLESLPSAIDYTILKQVNMEDLPQGIHQENQILLTISHSLPSLHNALSSLSSHNKLVALVADLFSVETLDIAKQFNILHYVYFPTSAMSLTVCLYLPNLDQTISSEFKDLNEPIILPGCIPIRGSDLPDPLPLGRCSDAYKSMVHICSKLKFTDGIIMNSFNYLEKRVIHALQEKEANNKVPVYPVGPNIRSGSISQVNGPECLKWLDFQPQKSVLYVAFGSGGTLSQKQLNELAFGLEMSGHRFLWAVRAPSESPSAAYLSNQESDPLQYLPNGFLERIHNGNRTGQGLVVASWAPQVEVLSHGSTGGFLSHCGWSSTLESVVHGIPIIAWPLFAEQRTNAVMLSEELKVAIRPKMNKNGIVQREEIARVVKCLMEGDEGREMSTRIRELKDAAGLAFSEDGSSTKTLSSLALKWKKL